MSQTASRGINAITCLPTVYTLAEENVFLLERHLLLWRLLFCFFKYLLCMHARLHWPPASKMADQLTAA